MFPLQALRMIVVDPASPETVYVLMASSVFGLTTDVFKSTDGGATWSRGVSPGDGFSTVLVIDPITTTTLYAGGVNGVAKTTDGGLNWTLMNSGLLPTDVSALAVDPANPATVYAGTHNSGVFKSIDGGASWLDINAGLDNGRIVGVVIDPFAPSTLYAGTFGAGVYKTIDGGTTWFAGSNNGIAASNISAVAINRIQSFDRVYGNRKRLPGPCGAATAASRGMPARPGWPASA